MPDPVVVPCPHCKKSVAVPEDYLGRVVSCLDCLAPFRAPLRENGGLTEPVALARSRGVPVKLFIPLFGLMVLGVAGLVLNAFLLTDAEAARNVTRSTVDQLFQNEPPEKKEWKAADSKRAPTNDEMDRRLKIAEQFERDRRRGVSDMADAWPSSRPFRIGGLVASGVVLAGGLALLLRRGYAVAFAGCAAAVVNSPDLGCCFAGVLVAGWGFMALVSDEGRRWFRRKV